MPQLFSRLRSCKFLTKSWSNLDVRIIASVLTGDIRFEGGAGTVCLSIHIRTQHMLKIWKTERLGQWMAVLPGAAVPVERSSGDDLHERCDCVLS